MNDDLRISSVSFGQSGLCCENNYFNVRCLKSRLLPFGRMEIFPAQPRMRLDESMVIAMELDDKRDMSIQ